MRKAITIAPCFIRAERQHQFAIEDFAIAIQLSPREADPYLGRGLSYLAAGDLKAAAADLDNAVMLEEQNVAAWTSRGLAYERMGDKEKAAGSYAQGAERGPELQGGDRRISDASAGNYGKSYQAF